MFFGLWFFVIRRLAEKQGMGGFMSIGKSRAKVYVEKQTGVTFADVAGVDEAGRGPLAGPVVAAAVILDDLKPIKGLADSKQLTARRREKLYDEIRAKALCCSIAQASVEEIDRLNILNATMLAMQRAVAGLGMARRLTRAGEKSNPISITKDEDGVWRFSGAPDARAEHDAGRQRVGQVFELLGQHVAGLQVGHHQDVGVAGDDRFDALGLRGDQRHRVVEAQRPVQHAAGDLAAVGHLAQRRGVQRRDHLRVDRLDR